MEKKQKIKLELRLQAVTTADKIGVVKSARLYGITRKTLSDWIKKYKSAGTAGLLNQSRTNQHHPSKTPAEIRQQILTYASEQPKATLAEIKKELQLDCSLMTINRIRKQASSLQLPPVIQNHSSLTFYVETFSAADSGFSYLFCCRDFKSGLLWTSVCNYNTPQALGVFADYIIQHLKLAEPLIYCSRGNFQLNKSSGKSYFEAIVQDKHKLNCLKSTFKFDEDSTLVNFLCQRSGLSSEDQLAQLYTIQSEINLRAKKMKPGNHIWLPPLLIDRHLINSQQIKVSSGYWTEQSGLLKEKFRLVMQQLFEQKSEVKNLSALISLEELYELSLYSELEDPELKMQLQFEIGRALCSAGLYDQAITIYQRILRNSTRSKNRGDYASALKAIAKIHFQKGELKQALDFYQKLLKESAALSKVSSKKISPQDPVLEIYLNCALCLKKSGRFAQALYYYNQAEKMALTPEAQQLVVLERVNLFHIKGNYHKAIKLLLPLLNYSGTSQIEIYENLYENSFLSGDYHGAEHYSRLKCSLIDARKNPQLYNLERAKIGFIIYARDKIPVAADYFTGAVQDYNRIIQSDSENKLTKISAYYKLAAIALLTGEVHKSIELHKKVLLICYEINNPELISYTLILLSVDYSELGDYRQALKYSKKQLGYLQPLNNYSKIKECKVQIAGLYKKLSEFNKSLAIFQNIIKTAESDDDLVILLRATLGCFEIYLQQKNAEEADKMLTRYHQLSEKQQVKRFNHHYWVMLASYNMLIDEADLKNFEQINLYFKKALRLTKSDKVFKDYAELSYQYLLFLQNYRQDKLFAKTTAQLAKHPLINGQTACLDKLQALINNNSG